MRPAHELDPEHRRHPESGRRRRFARSEEQYSHRPSRRLRRGDLEEIDDLWEFGPRPYWERTRGAMAALCFVLPLIGLYEAGLHLLAGEGAIRTGADAWIHRLCAGAGGLPPWAPSLAIVGILVAWQIVERREWWCPVAQWVGMLAESAILGVGLVGLSRLVDLGFTRLEGHELLAGGPPPSPILDHGPMAVGFLGAGVYEETIFRLLLIPLLYGLLRILQAPKVMATTFAVTASALLFSVAHHIGDPADDFQWFVFIFRWAAGVYFAWVFLLRGFAIAVGAHVAYDVLVGCVGWSW
jgi:hypothetical protein